MTENADHIVKQGGVVAALTASPLTNTSTLVPTIFAITPTYARATQKVDMTTVCHTFMHVPKLVWIVIEDSPEKTQLVTDLLARCKVQSVHLNVRTPLQYQLKQGHPHYEQPRGVAQRNAGLRWLRQNCALSNCSGVVYFADDDNKYDLRLFDEIRKTQGVSIFMIGFGGLLKFEGPMCANGKAVSWIVGFAPWRKVPVDMAGFAINLRKFLEKPNVVVGTDKHGKTSEIGMLETDLLEHFTTKETAECRGSNREVYVWHTHTKEPNFDNEKKIHSHPPVEY